MLSRFSSAKLILLPLRRANTQRTFSQSAAIPTLTEEQLRDICRSNAVHYASAKELVKSQLWLVKGTADVSEKQIVDKLSSHFSSPASTQAFFNSLKLLIPAKTHSFKIESPVRFTKPS